MRISVRHWRKKRKKPPFTLTGYVFRPESGHQIQYMRDSLISRGQFLYKLPKLVGCVLRRSFFFLIKPVHAMLILLGSSFRDTTQHTKRIKEFNHATINVSLRILYYTI